MLKGIILFELHEIANFEGQISVKYWQFQVIQLNILSIRKTNIGMGCSREYVGFLLLKIFDKRLYNYLS